MLEIFRSFQDNDEVVSVPDNSLIVLDTFTIPANASGYAGMITPHGEYVESRLRRVIGETKISKIDLGAADNLDVARKFIKSLLELEANVDTSIPQVVSMSAVPQFEIFDLESRKSLDELMSELRKKGVVFVAALDNNEPDIRSIKYPEPISPIYSHSIVTNGFAKKGEGYVPLGKNPTIADITGLADFSIKGDSLESESRESTGNSLIAPEIATGVILILQKLNFLLPDENTQETTLEDLADLREKVILMLLRKSCKYLDGESKFMKYFDIHELAKVLEASDFSELKLSVENFKSGERANAGDLIPGMLAPQYDWGAHFLPYRFGGGGNILGLTSRIETFLSQFHGESFHFTNDSELYVVESTNDGYKITHPSDPNEWILSKLAINLNNLVTEVRN